MVKKLFDLLLVELALVLAGSQAGQCQNDTYLIRAVTDNETKNPVTGANITIVGTHYGIVSDSTGRFVIQGPPIGSRTVKVSHVGYATKYCPATIDSGRIILLNVLLSEAAIALPAVTVLGEHMLDDFYRMSASADVTAKDIQNNEFIDFEGIFLRYAYFMANDDYALFVDGIRTDPEILKTINVCDVKEVFIWRWAMAPVELTERLGSTEIDKTPNGGFEVHWSELDYVVLVNTR